MANVFRYVRGDTRAIALPGHAADAIEIGDLVFWDAANNAVRPADKVSGSDYPAKQAAFAGARLGVAMTAKAANAAGVITVATDGDFVFTAPSGTGTAYAVGDAVGVGNGTAVVPDTVAKTTDANKTVATVIRSKTTAENNVTIRLLSRLG